MNTWTQELESVFDDAVAEFGDTLTYNGEILPCIKTPLDMQFEIQVSGYNRLIDTQIDVKRSAAFAIHLTRSIDENPVEKHPVVTVDGVEFIVGRIQDDDSADPCVKLLCSRKQ